MISMIQFRNVATSAMRAVKHSNHKFARRVWLEGCWYHNVFPFLKLESGKHFSVVDVGPGCSHLPVFVEERRLKSTLAAADGNCRMSGLGRHKSRFAEVWPSGRSDNACASEQGSILSEKHAVFK